jgi:HlyD family secretion protein
MNRTVRSRLPLLFLIPAVAALAHACGRTPPDTSLRASGHVEATEVQFAAQVGGRLLALNVGEGDRVESGQVIAEIDPTDIQLALRRADADRAQAQAQLQLLLAGARAEDIRQAQAQVASAEADVSAAEAELQAAVADLERFETLLQASSGSRKQRDDAVTRRDVARERVSATRERVRAARETLARLRNGARPEEIQAARARVASADAQVATFQQNLADATVEAPVGGVVTEKLADVGELLAPRAPLVVVADMDHVWANVYVGERQVPRIKLGQPATVYTDAGGAGMKGTVTFVSSKAEFTPRNVQTAEERSKLVYRIKVTVDNRGGVLKQGMPVEAEIPLQPLESGK